MPTPDLSYHTRVAFHHTDAAGIVHFANYFLFAEEAETHALAQLGLPGPAQGMYYPRISVNAHYSSPLRFTDPLSVTPHLTHIGNSSLHWQFDIATPQKHAATLTAICARRDADNHPAPFTQAERQLLAPLLHPNNSTPPIPPEKN